MKTKDKKHSVFAQVKYILDKSYRDNIPALAGQSAFFLLLSAIPLPDPAFEKRRVRIRYDPLTAHDYSKDKPSLREIVPGHFIQCNDAEFAQYQRQLGLKESGRA